MKQRDGFKIETPHRDDCWCENDEDGLVFLVDKGTVYLDRIGRKIKYGGCSWARYICNDPRCPGAVLVRWDVLGKFITAGARAAA